MTPNKEDDKTRAELIAVMGERRRQRRKWGKQEHDAFCWLTILTEEVGEAAQAALHDEFGGWAAGTLYEEVLQVAAVAVQWLEDLKEKKYV